MPEIEVNVEAAPIRVEVSSAPVEVIVSGAQGGTAPVTNENVNAAIADDPAATREALEIPINNFTAVTTPTINDDSGDGYAAGSKWYDTVSQEAYICVDATVGAAVWILTTLDAEDLGSAAFEDTLAFATAAQGALADTALQSSDLSGYIKTNGLLTTGAILSINADPSKFNRAAGSAYIRGQLVTWAAENGITVTNLATSNLTHVFVDADGNTFQQTTSPLPDERRDRQYLGQLGHASRTSIASVSNNPDVASDPNQKQADWLRCIGIYSCEGNMPSANGANLSINVGAGELFGEGIGWTTDTDNPNELEFASLTAPSVRMRTQTGLGSSSTSVDVNNYDVAGTITAVPSNKWQNMRIYRLTTNNIVVQYGQTTYNTQSAAIAGVQSETFVKLENVKTIGALIGILTVKQGATALNDTNQAAFWFPTSIGQAVAIPPLNLGAEINSATSKATPVDADEIGYADSAASYAFKKATFLQTWTNYFKVKADALYVALTGNQTVAGNKTFSGQTELTGQAATNGTSALNRDLGDARFQNLMLPSRLISTANSSTWSQTTSGSGIGRSHSSGGIFVYSSNTTNVGSITAYDLLGSENRWSIGSFGGGGYGGIDFSKRIAIAFSVGVQFNYDTTKQDFGVVLSTAAPSAGIAAMTPSSGAHYIALVCTAGAWTIQVCNNTTKTTSSTLLTWTSVPQNAHFMLVSNGSGTVSLFSNGTLLGSVTGGSTSQVAANSKNLYLCATSSSASSSILGGFEVSAPIITWTP